MMLYLAAKFQHKEICLSLIPLLTNSGHIVIGRWLSGGHEQDVEDVGLRRLYAEEDLDDIGLADAVVLLQLPVEQPEPSTGRFIEAGYALGIGKPLIVVGKADCVFFHLPEVVRYPTIESFVAAYAGGARVDPPVASPPRAAAGRVGPTRRGLGGRRR